ncbi:MAG: hypothetical protein ACTSWW_06335 [Promethearchaeota archaeon]
MLNEKTNRIKSSFFLFIVLIFLLPTLMLFSSLGDGEILGDSQESSRIFSSHDPSSSSNSFILDFEVFSNASQYEIFTENDTVVILYTLYYSQPDPYYMVLQSNETILLHQRIVTPIYRFILDVNTSILGVFNIHLNIYSEEVFSLEDLHPNFLIYQDHRIIEIKEGESKHLQLPEIFLQVGKFSTIALVSVVGGVLTFFGTRHRVELRQLKQIQELFQNPKVKSEFLTLKKENIFLNHNKNRHIFQFCIDNIHEIDLNVSDYDEHQFWETIVDGGLIL